MYSQCSYTYISDALVSFLSSSYFLLISGYLTRVLFLVICLCSMAYVSDFV